MISETISFPLVIYRINLFQLYNDLKYAKITGMQVYKKEEIPDSFHLKRSPLVNDIFLKADKGYFLKAVSYSLSYFSTQLGSLNLTKAYAGIFFQHPRTVKN